MRITDTHDVERPSSLEPEATWAGVWHLWTVFLPRRSINCQACALKGQCTTGKERRLSRWEHEAVLEAVQTRLDRNPDKMSVRRQTVEHPFGTIKSWMGATHFQMKTLKNVSTEMALHVLAYNMKRVMRILGVGGLMEAIRI